jgi:fatty acyl-CoA reductase
MASQLIQCSVTGQLLGKCLLLTGATGYLGSLVLEALLRTTDVALIYVLLRPAGNRTAAERLRQLLAKNLFHKVRDQQSLLDRIQAIDGDLSLPGLGIEAATREKLRSSVEIILHSAADIRLEVDIQTTLKSNYLGTGAILDLAASMPKLKAVVHVSTAFVNMNQPRSSIIEEKLYPLHYGTRRVDAQELVQVSKCTYCSTGQLVPGL